MSKKNVFLKTVTLIFTLLSAIFVFFPWFKLSVPLFDSILESGSYSISLIGLPALVEESALGLITTLGGKTASITVLILCGVLKYMCVLSAGLGVCGIWKCCIRSNPTRLIFSSQVIALGLQVLSFIIVLIINIFLDTYAGSIAASMNMDEELFNFHFVPTMWLWLSTASAICSLTTSMIYNKRI